MNNRSSDSHEISTLSTNCNYNNDDSDNDLVGFKKACARTHRRNSIFPTFHSLNNLNILLNVFYIKKDLKKHFINILKH